ncbi:hypothetical protein [Marinimicrobium sp. ABcell2]|uniref:hypothetical protein n=1 Tax=Marinimicrobium sp. ABcell2 TaxID=3069751 RepID=UPI0027AE5BAD|nr:hypothetical protein [Marinimicrobium sp. ABcell2]MDQ2077531.1 hypothetical protein [Marinimicrobium sp. ABcell2]
MDIESLPYVLCPDIPDQEIRVTPFWFRPKGGGAECPVVHLENVPVGFHSVLDASGFVQRPEGWFIDAHDKTERWWRAIFGPINFVQRKPVKIYEPERIIFAPPPASVKVILTQYGDEHVEYLTKGANIFGRDAQRAAKNDALRGAVNCRGAWAIIKAACMDRLERNPEDAQTFEYVWGTAKTYSLDTQDIPSEISHTLLLDKIVDRRRLTAQMERVVPVSYVSSGAVSTLCWADWPRRCAYIGASHGGPVDIREFSDVDGLAQFLLDGKFQPLADPARLAEWAERVSQCQAEEAEPDWTQTLGDMELPEQEGDENAADETTPVEGSNTATIHNTTSSRSLPWSEVVARLVTLAVEVERRVPYARVLCRHLFDTVLTQRETPLAQPAYLSNFEALIQHFAGVLNRDSLTKHMNRHQEPLRDLGHALAPAHQGRYQLMRVLNSPSSAHEFVNARLDAGAEEGHSWWWTGFTCGQIPGSDNWQLYRVTNKGDCVPVGTGLYRTARDANDALYNMARETRLRVFRVELRGKRCFHGYATTTGHIVRLSDDFEDEESARAALAQSRMTYLSQYREPILWERKPLAWNAAEARRLLLEAFNALQWPTSMVDMFGELTITDNGDAVVLGVEGGFRSTVYPGTLLLHWAKGLYHWASEHHEALFTEMAEPLLGSWQYAQLDISIEDDLYDDLAEYQREVEMRLGTAALSILRQAIGAPSREAESQIAGFVGAVQSEASAPLMSLLRGIALVSAQHAPYRRLTPAYREALSYGLDSRVMPFVYAVARYTWYRLHWADAYEPRLCASGAPGDDVAAELAPVGAALWEFGQHLERLMVSAAAEHEREPNQAAHSMSR